MMVVAPTESITESPKKNSRLRVGFLTICPSPYIEELFAAMDDDGRIAPRVFYQEWLSPAFSWDRAELPEYSTVLESRILKFMGARLFLNTSAVRTIARHDYDMFVIAGYASITSQLVMRWLNRQKIPWCFWGEIPGFQQRGRLGRFLRQQAMRPVLKHACGVAAVGQRAAASYRSLFLDRCPVASIPYYSDVRAFGSAIRNRSPDDQTIQLLFCGQLVPRKGVLELVRAAIHLMADHDLGLTLLGDGELEDELRALIPEELQARFRFEGFRQIRELPAYFADADIFVLPSRHDGWGVVINQALAAGLPIISTDAVGAAIDLVKDGTNGRMVKAGDEESLKSAIHELVVEEAERNRMGQASRSIAEEWTGTVEVDRWCELFGAAAPGECLP